MPPDTPMRKGVLPSTPLSLPLKGKDIFRVVTMLTVTSAIALANRQRLVLLLARRGAMLQPTATAAAAAGRSSRNRVSGSRLLATSRHCRYTIDFCSAVAGEMVTRARILYLCIYIYLSARARVLIRAIT